MRGVANGLAEQLEVNARLAELSSSRSSPGPATAIARASTGVVAASVISMGLISLPIMMRYGYDERLASGVIAASGTLAQIIPPSLVLITIGSVTGVSIAGLFTGGLVPALVLAATLCVIVWWKTRHDDLSGIRRSSSREILVAFLIAMPGIALPFLIRAAVVEGVATATEVSRPPEKAMPTRSPAGIFCRMVAATVSFSRCLGRRIL